MFVMLFEPPRDKARTWSGTILKPKLPSTSSGFPTHILNDIYNSVDAIITTTLGEGWGLSISEGMAVKKPVIAPDHTSISEILGKTNAGTAERGILVKTKDGFVQQHDNSRVRPITDAEDMADKMEMVMENRAALQPMVDKLNGPVNHHIFDFKQWGACQKFNRIDIARKEDKANE